MVEFWTTFIEEPWALFRLDVEEMIHGGDDRVLALITFTGIERGYEHRGHARVRPPGCLPGRGGLRIDAYSDWGEAREAAGLD